MQQQKGTHTLARALSLTGCYGDYFRLHLLTLQLLTTWLAISVITYRRFYARKHQAQRKTRFPQRVLQLYSSGDRNDILIKHRL